MSQLSLHYAEWHYAERRYAEYHYAECRDSKNITTASFCDCLVPLVFFGLRLNDCFPSFLTFDHPIHLVPTSKTFRSIRFNKGKFTPAKCATKTQVRFRRRRYGKRPFDTN